MREKSRDTAGASSSKKSTERADTVQKKNGGDYGQDANMEEVRQGKAGAGTGRNR